MPNAFHGCDCCTVSIGGTVAGGDDGVWHFAVDRRRPITTTGDTDAQRGVRGARTPRTERIDDGDGPRSTVVVAGTGPRSRRPASLASTRQDDAAYGIQSSIVSVCGGRLSPLRSSARLFAESSAHASQPRLKLRKHETRIAMTFIGVSGDVRHGHARGRSRADWREANRRGHDLSARMSRWPGV